MASKIIPTVKNVFLSQKLPNGTGLCQRIPLLVQTCSYHSKIVTKKSWQNVERVLEKNPSENKPAHRVRYQKPKLKLLLQGMLQGKDFSEYTHVPIPYPKTGGRDHSGRTFNKRMGGGAKQMYRMVDFTRNAISESEPLVERILKVSYDPLRSADIALVCNGNHKRWILASANMRAGELVRSFADIPKFPVAAKEGDAHPLGALAIGTVVHNIELFEKHGGSVARAAGTCGTLSAKHSDHVVIQMPSGREMSVSKHCMGTVGRVSQIKKPIGSAQRNRWFGVRPKSGLWHKKTGYNGRKIRPPKKMIAYRTQTKEPLSEMFD